MAEITRRRSGELVRGVFSILMPHKEGLPAKDVLAALEQKVPPTEFERTTYQARPDVRRFERIVRFSTIRAVKAGWLVKDKGSWSLTDDGRAAYEKFKDPEKFDREASQLYRQWRRGQPDEEEAEPESPGAATTLEEAEEGAWAEIKGHLDRMSPFDFQDLVAGLLRGMGYHIGFVAPPGPDRGIDIIASSDPLGLSGPRIKVQVKRRADSIHVDGVRSFIATLGTGDVGLFVSTGGFTKDAAMEARGQETRRVVLIDQERLFDLWVEHYDRIPETWRRLLPLKPIYYLLPEE